MCSINSQYKVTYLNGTLLNSTVFPLDAPPPPPLAPPVATVPSVSDDCCLSSFLCTSWSKDLDLLKAGLLLSLFGSESEFDVIFSSWKAKEIKNSINDCLFTHLESLRLSCYSACAGIFLCLKYSFFQFSCKFFFELFVLGIKSVLFWMAINPNFHTPHILLDNTWHAQACQW